MLHGNVTKAAHSLSLSQSAVSHSLGRLREEFADALFVRTPKGVTPTPKALMLREPILQALDRCRLVFESPASFNPRMSSGDIRISSTDYIEQILLPKLIPHLQKNAPHMVLHSRNLQGQLPKLAMERGECDLAIAGFFEDLPDGFYRQVLFEDGFSTIVRKGHPILKDKVTLKSYLAYDHILISPQGDMNSLVDAWLKKKKMKTKIIAGISNFLTPGWVVAGSDVILTAPQKLINFFVNCGALSVQEISTPVEVPTITMVQVWHERTHRDPMLKWFRETLCRIFSDKLKVTNIL